MSKIHKGEQSSGGFEVKDCFCMTKMCWYVNSMEIKAYGLAHRPKWRTHRKISCKHMVMEKLR